MIKNFETGRIIDIYIRKENREENLDTGYGRLQWLMYELEDYKDIINIYIDEPNEVFAFEDMINQFSNADLHSVLLWSVEDVTEKSFKKLSRICTNKEIPVISFCENRVWLNELINQYYQQEV